MRKNKINFTLGVTFAIVGILMSGCTKTISYSELLNQEEKATNWFMANQKIINEIPADSIFEYGKDAPFYKMDKDGYMYMQVVVPGTKDNKAEDNELIYFRYLKTNIKYLYEGMTVSPTGNANDMSQPPTYFYFNNMTVSTSAAHGSGVQLPLHYLGVDCEVNMVIRSYYGNTGEIGQCQPYLYNLKYYRSQM